MGRLYGGNLRKKLQKWPYHERENGKKEGGGLNRGPEAQIAKKKEGGGVTLSAVSTGHHDAI